MWGIKPKWAETGRGGTKPILSAPEIHPDPDGSVVCCGKPMKPQFRHVRDRDGQMIFVAVPGSRVAVAVGIPVTRYPPHGSVRALISGRVRQWRGPGFE